MKQILIIEDDETIRDELSFLLRLHQYQVLLPSAFDQIESVLLNNTVHLILLDIHLPETNGFTICQNLRKISNVPIVFVTSSIAEEDEVRAMMIGGDDFITKPYRSSVLLARIGAILTRHDPENHKELTVRGVTLHLQDGTISYQNQTILLSKNEFRILYHFFLHAGTLVSKEALINYLWENKLYVDENILNVNIARIRKKLIEIGLDNFITTIYGKGYQI